MKFKEFRDLIFSPCYVVLGQMRCFVETHEQTDFDEYEVEGVRANTFDEFDECIVVDLVEKDFKDDVNVDWLNRATSSTIGKNISAGRNE